MLRKRWLRCSLAVLSMSSALSGCAPPERETESDLQAACGRSIDLQEVELYDGGYAVSRAFVNRHRLAVGLLRWRGDIALRYRDQAGNVSGVAWCTGTLISNDLFLTAAHCVSNDDPKNFRLPRERDGARLKPTELAREFTVEFRNEVSGQTGLSSVGKSFEVLRLEEYRFDDLDYAILRLSEGAGMVNGVARVSPKDTEPGTTVALLQHPAGSPMKIGAGAVASVEGARISYDTIDTLGGSSGAGILDAQTGKLVGIHTNGGCTQSDGGANYGVTIGALLTASPTLQDLVDRSKDFFVGNWDNDATADLAVFHEGCLYPDANHDDAPDLDLRQCAVDTGASEYFVGHWRAGFPTRLGWRRGGCVFLDTDPRRPLCYGAERDRFEILVADWNGDTQSDLGIQRGACIDFDIDLDGMVDQQRYCYGNGLGEDQYLVGNWDGSRDSVAVRRGNTVEIDLNRDGLTDEIRSYGDGGNEAQYLAGDWNGDGRATLAVRRGNLCHMSQGEGPAGEGRDFRDFWSKP